MEVAGNKNQDVFWNSEETETKHPAGWANPEGSTLKVICTVW